MVLRSALSLLQLYQSALTSTSQWFEEAEAILKQRNQELESEDLAESLRKLEDVLIQGPNIKKAVQVIEDVLPKMESFVESSVLEKLKEEHETSCRRRADLMEQLRCHQETLHR